MDSPTEAHGVINIDKWSTTNTQMKPSAVGMELVTLSKSDEARDSMAMKKDIQPVHKDKQIAYTPIVSSADTLTDPQSDTVDKPATSQQETDIKPLASIFIKQEAGLDSNLPLQHQVVKPQTTTPTILIKRTYTKLSQSVETRQNINIGSHIKTEKPKDSSTIKSRITYKKPVTLNLSTMPKCFVLLKNLDVNQIPLKQEPLVVTPIDIKQEPSDVLEVSDGSSEQILKCDKCAVKFDSMQELIDHKVSHIKKSDTATNVNSCPICCYEVHGMAHLHIHMKSHNIKSEDKSMLNEPCILQEKFQTTYLCDLCKKNCKSQVLLRSHFQKCHKNIFRTPGFRLVKRYICTVCEKMYRGEHSVAHHIANCHLPLMGPKLPVKVVCVRFTDNDLNVSGFLTTSLSKTFSCKICGIDLGCKQKAAMHMLDVHCNSK